MILDLIPVVEAVGWTYFQVWFLMMITEFVMVVSLLSLFSLGVYYGFKVLTKDWGK